MRNETANAPRFGITYTLTNDNWPAKTDPQRLAAIEKKKPVYWEWRRKIDPNHNLFPLLKFGGFVFGVAFLIVALFVCFRSNPRKQK